MDTHHLHSDVSTCLNPVIARELPESERMLALPRHFGHRLLTFENAVYGFMSHFGSQYRGGLWRFYELSNQGFYMVPEDGSYQISIDSNGYEGVMAADAAGITVCLFAYSHLSFRDGHGSLYARHFHRLREFALTHAESREIFAAID